MRIVIYSLAGCPWCDAAKSKLLLLRLPFHVIETRHGGTPKRMPDGRVPESFPQIWVDGVARGGFADMDAWLPKTRKPIVARKTTKKKTTVAKKKRVVAKKKKTTKRTAMTKRRS